MLCETDIYIQYRAQQHRENKTRKTSESERLPQHRNTHDKNPTRQIEREKRAADHIDGENNKLSRNGNGGLKTQSPPASIQYLVRPGSFTMYIDVNIKSYFPWVHKIKQSFCRESRAPIICINFSIHQNPTSVRICCAFKYNR